MIKIPFENLESSDLIVDTIYKGGILREKLQKSFQSYYQIVVILVDLEKL